MKYLCIGALLLSPVFVLHAQETPSRHSISLSLGRERAVYFGRFCPQYQVAYQYQWAPRCHVGGGLSYAGLKDYQLADNTGEAQHTQSFVFFAGLDYTLAHFWNRLKLDFLVQGRLMSQRLSYTPEIRVENDRVVGVTRSEYRVNKVLPGAGIRLVYDWGAHFFLGFQGYIFYLPGKNNLLNPRVAVIRDNSFFSTTSSSTASPLSPLCVQVLAGYRF
jgi:hypothetical protein